MNTTYLMMMPSFFNELKSKCAVGKIAPVAIKTSSLKNPLQGEAALLEFEQPLEMGFFFFAEMDSRRQRRSSSSEEVKRRPTTGKDFI